MSKGPWCTANYERGHKAYGMNTCAETHQHCCYCAIRTLCAVKQLEGYPVLRGWPVVSHAAPLRRINTAATAL